MNPNESSTPSPYRSSILLSYLSTMLLWGAIYIYMPILTPYTQHVSGSLQAVGLVMGDYGLSQMLLRIPVGILSDRWRRRKPFILLGFVFDGLANLGLLLATNAWMIIGSAFTAGIASSIWVPFTVLFSNYFPAGKMAHSMSLLTGFSRLSQILTTYAGGVIAENWGWTAPFLVGGGLAALGLLLSNGLAEIRPEKGPHLTLSRILQVGRNRMLLIASFLAILVQSANCSSALGFTPILAQQLGASKEDLGILLFSFLFPNTLGTLLSGTLIRRYVTDRSIVIFGFLTITAALIATPFVDRLSILNLIQAVNGVGVGLLFPLLMSLAVQSTFREEQATAMGFFQSLYAVGMTAGPILSGFIAQQWGLPSLFHFNALLCLFGALFSLKKIPSAPRGF